MGKNFKFLQTSMNTLQKNEKGEEGKILRLNSIALLLLLLASILLSPFAFVPVQADDVYGPKADYLHIKNWASDIDEFLALEGGTADITDWPIYKEYIDKWVLGPDGIPNNGDEFVPDKITLRDYSEFGYWFIEVYNQRWPTGVGDREEDVLTYDEDTGTYKHYFDPTNQWDLKAWHFRLALEYLMDRDYVKTDILKGLGYMLETEVPPVLGGWVDRANLTNSWFITPYGVKIPSLIYSKNVTKAQELLDAAGFTMITSGPNAGKRQDPRKAAGQALDPLIFYLRSDDLNRKLAGEKLADDLEAIGVPVNRRVAAKTTCFKAVMVDYDFNLYTAGVGIGQDPDYLYGAIDSSQYWGMPFNSPKKNPPYNYPNIGWSVNTAGSAYHDVDHYTMDLLYLGATKEDIVTGVHGATYLENKYAIHIPLWSYASVQGYRTGWNDVVNQFGYGVSAPVVGGAIPWSFITMSQEGRDTINWAFKSKAEDLSVISAEWVWDWNILTLVYEMLLVTNPYNPAEDWPWLAETVPTVANGGVGTWIGPDGEATTLNFTLRQDAYWHDGTQLTPDDVAFSIRFTRDCGPGIAWNYPMGMNIDHVEKWNYTAAVGGDWGVKVYFNIKSFFALHRVGWMPIFKKDIWMAASPATAEGFLYVEGDPGHFDGPAENVRSFLLYQDNWYKPGDGKVDLREDGSGPWKFVECDSTLDLYYDLEANRNWWMSQTELSDKISEAFHAMGDVNRDRQVSTEDLSAIAHALLTTPSSPHTPPGGWWVWNSDADLDKSNDVSGDDLARAGKSYGMNAG